MPGRQAGLLSARCNRCLHPETHCANLDETPRIQLPWPSHTGCRNDLRIRPVCILRPAGRKQRNGSAKHRLQKSSGYISNIRLARQRRINRAASNRIRTVLCDGAINRHGRRNCGLVAQIIIAAARSYSGQISAVRFICQRVENGSTATGFWPFSVICESTVIGSGIVGRFIKSS